MAVMTLVYLAPALFNLGSFDVPQTEWSAGEPGMDLHNRFGA